MKNIKDLFDPETYTEKIKELAGKTTEIVTDLSSKLAGCFSSFGKGASDAFSLVAEKCSNTFSKMRKGLNKFNVSFKNSVKGFLAGGGAFTVMAMGAKSLFSLLDAGMKNLQQETLDLLDNLSDVFSQYEKMGKGQEKKAETNKSALSALESLQLQDDPLNNEQRLNSEKYIETLKKSYQDLNVEIDETTGKIKNFEEIQAKVLSGDREKEADNLKRQIKTLEKQNNLAADNLKKGSTFSEYISNVKEQYGWGNAKESGGVLQKNIEKLLELRKKLYDLEHEKDPGTEANRMYRAKMQDKEDKKAQRARQETETKSGDKTGTVQGDETFNSNHAEQIKQEQTDEIERKNLQKAKEAEEEKKKAEEGRKNLNEQLKGKAESLKDTAMRNAGYGREAAQEKALRNAEKTKGSALTEKEKARVIKNADLEWDMEHREAPQLGDLAIKTNSLTSRGGFATGAVMPDKDAVNRRLVEETRKMNEILGQISKKVDDIGKF